MTQSLGSFIPALSRWSPILWRLGPLFLFFSPIFDRFIPGIASQFLSRTLEEWKARGLIRDYRVKVTRAGVLAYRIDVRISLTKEQVKGRIKDLLAKLQ